MRELLSTTALQTLLRRERGCADRNGHEFSLLILSSNALAQKSKAARRLAQILFRRIRFTDLAGWLKPNEIALILPYTNAAGAKKLAEDLGIMLAAACPQLKFRIFSYPGERQEAQSLPPAQRNGTGSDPAARRVAHALGEGYAEAANRNPIVTQTAAFAPVAPEKLAQVLQPFPVWKRTMDIVGALAGLILLSPLLLAIGCAIKLNSPGPMLFHQLRLGRGGAPFRMFKFRSMQNGADENVHRDHLQELITAKNAAGIFKLDKDARVTGVGKFIRKWSLDELPQLWNVLIGDMTLVGPRPEPCYAQECYARWYHRRTLEIKPGITGLWQVEGRSRVPYEEMIRMDLRYCQSLSFHNDFKLLLRTFKAVWSHAGAY